MTVGAEGGNAADAVIITSSPALGRSSFSRRCRHSTIHRDGLHPLPLADIVSVRRRTDQAGIAILTCDPMRRAP